MRYHKTKRRDMHRGVAQVAAYGAPVSPFNPFEHRPTQESRGTAFFVRVRGVEDPVLLTCAHVVEDAGDSVKITLPALGQQPIPVSVVAICQRHDIAMLRLTPEDALKHREIIQPLELGNDHDVRFGDTLEALGFPLGVDKVKTMRCTFNGIQNGMQIDCAINGGHSGGPLICGGKVVAWVTSGIDPMMANSTSYASPISHYYSVQNAFDAAARAWRAGASAVVVSPPSLGILYHNGSQALVTEGCGGVVIYHVLGNSPLRPALPKLVTGTKLCSIGFTSRHAPTGYHKYEVDYAGQVAVPWYIERVPLKYVVAEVSDDQEVDVTLVTPATGETSALSRTVKVTLAPDAGSGGFRRHLLTYERPAHVEFAGLVLMQLSANHREGDNSQNGAHVASKLQSMTPQELEEPSVVVTLVVPGSRAHHTNVLEPGDLLSTVNDCRVQTLDDVLQALQLRPVATIVERGGRSVALLRAE